MAKRGAGNYLTDKNWHEEEEPEEAGVFAQASADVLEKRVIKTAKRKVPVGGNDGGASSSGSGGGGAFKGFAGFTSVKPSSATDNVSPSRPLFSISSTTATPFTPATPSTTGAVLDPVGSSRSFSGGITMNMAAGGGCLAAKDDSAARCPSSTGSMVSLGATSSTDVAVKSAASKTDVSLKSVSAVADGKPTGPANNDEFTLYKTELAALNKSVLEWLTEHVGKTPSCILLPVFDDYRKHIAALDLKYPNAKPPMDVNTNGTQAPTASSVPGLVSFGTTMAASGGVKSDTPSLFSFGPVSSTAASTSANMATSVGGKFSFSQAATSPPTAISRPVTSATFLSQSNTVTQPSFSSGFSFSESRTPANVATATAQPATGGLFSFGTKPPVTSDLSEAKPVAGFDFGWKPATNPASTPPKPAATSGLFNFGAKPATTMPSLFDSGPQQPAASSGLFDFGARPAVGLGTRPATGPLGAGFFSSSTAGGVTSTSLFGQTSTGGTFSFGTPSVQPTGSADGDEVSEETEGNNGEYVPPKPESVEIKEDDAFYTIRCKLFYKKDAQYLDRGIGNLYLKPCGDKTQLLIRTDTSTGTILLNIFLGRSTPFTRQGANNLSMVCAANPPIDPKAPSNTPVVFLIRVKTAEMREELLDEITKHSN